MSAGNRGVAGQEQKRIFGMAAAPKEAAGPWRRRRSMSGQVRSGQVLLPAGLQCVTTYHVPSIVLDHP